MKIGMLWFDNSKTPLEARMKRAADYYQNKYGMVANTAVVSPGEIEGETVEIDGVKTTANMAIAPKHIWIGRDPKAAPCQS